jgi:hypothetical protein
LTFARTPPIWLSFRSIRAAHDAHVIPSRSRVIVRSDRVAVPSMVGFLSIP